MVPHLTLFRTSPIGEVTPGCTYLGDFYFPESLKMEVRPFIFAGNISADPSVRSTRNIDMRIVVDGIY